MTEGVRSMRMCLVVTVAALGSPAIVSSASAAAVTLIEPSPADAAVFPTQRPPYRVPLFWSADTAGCQALPARAEAVVVGPDGLVTRGSLEGAPPSGGQNFVVSPPRRATYRWFVELVCAGLGPVRSELRTFTLAGPNPSPRLTARYRATFPAAGVSQTWRFLPRCREGACDTVLRRPGAPPALLRYNARRRIYRGSIGPTPSAVEAVCSLRRGTGVRTIPGTYRSRSTMITVRVDATGVDAAGIQRLAVDLVGRSSGIYVPNARGRRLGCGRGRITTPLRLDRIGGAR